jgi:iron(III) transport system ATP-binding protein
VTNLVASGIVKSFGRGPVLDGFDLSVPDGALAAIVGASGSGKTTFLRIAAGFERADAGRLELGDLVVDGESFVPPEERGIGYVPQEGALFPHLNVRRNVAFGLRRPARAGGRRVGELLDLVGLAGMERRYPHELSGGQQQRVALARALAIRPRVVLLDEPFSSLDAGLRASVRADVSAVLREAGTTAVLVTHDQDEALSFADLVAVLRDGRIVQADTPSSLYRRPVDPGVADFVGQANVLPAVVTGGDALCALGAVPVLDPPAPGSKVSVLVRPEQLRVAPLLVGGQGSGVEGVVTGSEYYGHDAIVRVSVLKPAAGFQGTAPAAAGSGSSVADGALRVVSRIAGQEPPAVGSRVALQVVGPCQVWPSPE